MDPSTTAPSPVKGLVKRLFRICSSIRVAIVVLLLLLLITWLGTEAQPHMGLFQAQEKYFNSWVLVHQAEAFEISLPLPGAKLLLVVFAFNLICGGIVMIRKSWRTAGVMIAHFSMLFLLAGGLLQHKYAEDGYMQLYEGGKGNEFISYSDWAIHIHEVKDGAADFSKEALVVPYAQLQTLAEGERRVEAPSLPFALKLYHFASNGVVLPEAFRRDAELPAVDGIFLRQLAVDKQKEANYAALYVDVLDAQGAAKQTSILSGQELQPLTIRDGDKAWVLRLERERSPMPFTIQLDKFTAAFHENGVAKTYESEVTHIKDGTEESRLIEMNEPLRDSGYIVFQSGYGPQDDRGRLIAGEKPFSVFAVWKNPTSKWFIIPVEHWPLLTVSIAALGIAIHFILKLAHHLGKGRRPKVLTAESA